MKEIDMALWERREHFEFFRRGDLPFYNVNFNLDISGLRPVVRRLGVSLNHALIHLTLMAMNRIDNFRYRLEAGRVVEHERLHPSFACLRPGEELFRLITLDHVDELVEFDRRAKEAIAASSAYFDLSAMAGRSDFVFISTLPWIPFTGIDHTQSLNRDDGIPRVSWGKFQETGQRTELPYNIRVNHAFVDGLHVGRFYQDLQSDIRKLAAN